MGIMREAGRLIMPYIADSSGFSSLSPEAAVLFCMLIPHYNPHGKIRGDSRYIKIVVCPRIPYLTEDVIDRCLTEITEKTSVKRFESPVGKLIHSLKFTTEHQKINPRRLGKDKLPGYPGDTNINTTGQTVNFEIQSRTTPDYSVTKKVNYPKCAKNIDPGFGTELAIDLKDLDLDLKDLKDQDQHPPNHSLKPKRGRKKTKPEDGAPPEGVAECDADYIARIKKYHNELPESFLRVWEDFYGGKLNTDACLFAATTWLIENPHNRKKNIKKFYSNWLRNQFTRTTQPRGG